MGAKLLVEGVAEQGQGVGERRVGQGGGGPRGWGKGAKGGGIYILMKYSTKQLQH